MITYSAADTFAQGEGWLLLLEGFVLVSRFLFILFSCLNHAVLHCLVVWFGLIGWLLASFG